MSVLLFRVSRKIFLPEGKTFIIDFEFLATDSMKYTLCFNHIDSILIQPTVEVEDSIPNKPGEMEEKQTSKSGKFYNTNLTLVRSKLNYLKCSQSSYSEFLLFFYFWQV